MSAARLVRYFSLASLLAIAPGLGGCPTDEPDPDPTPTPIPAEPAVSVSGNHAVQIGATLQLTASTADGTDAGYTWSSSDGTKATVDNSGLVSGVAAGEVSITVTGDDTGASATHGVVVTAEPVTFDTVVSVTGGFWLLVGDSVTLTATTVNGEDAGYTWSVDDASLASIDGGVLTGIAAGGVTVTATGDDTGISGTLGVVIANEIPNQDAWAGSGHADTTAEAFRHWDADGEVPTSCARCHSTPGYQDYIGADGTDAGVVDNAAPLGSTVECTACHNSVTATMASVTFPSGAVVDDLGPEARCMTCHQGRSSSDTVDQAITDAAVADDDTISADLGFINIHYYAAGATLMAGLARGGYQYADEVYDVRFRHVDQANTCVECHDPHSLEVQVTTCANCHEGVTVVDDLYDIRMMASSGIDFDGDGDLTEGIKGEMEGMRDVVYTALQAYATEGGFPLCYDSHAYPYFFNDTNADGACDAAEANYGGRYVSWTPRLLRGAYNFQVASKDPGAFAHNAKYMIELLYDSAMDVNGALTTPADLSGLVRNDPGHFNGSGEPARHWDEDEEVSASCSKCHSGEEGFRFYLEYGVGTEVIEQGNGLECGTCHNSYGTDDTDPDYYALVEVSDFALNNGDTFSQPDDASNICATCHSGRKVGADVDSALASSNPRFQNVHYLPAAGVRLGGDGHLGYEYGANTYAGSPTGHLLGDGCVDCHDAVDTGHSFDAHDAYAAGTCAPCHDSAGSLDAIKGASRGDYDGDGTAETLHDELAGMAAAVLQKAHDNDGLCYNAHRYPYFFTGGDAAGICTAADTTSYSGWTDSGLKASYNYQIWSKDPGAWAHNFDYMAQLLYDTYEDLGGDPATAGWTRPGTL